MDPEFQRALTIVLIAGGSIMAVATLVLFFAFRAFGGGMKTGRKLHLILIAALVVFVFACCLGLLVVSYLGD